MTPKTEAKHSPTPFKIKAELPGVNDIFALDAPNGTTKYEREVADVYGEANAAFLVKAANSHAALVEAAKETIAEIKEHTPGRHLYSIKILEAALLAAGEKV